MKKVYVLIVAGNQINHDSKIFFILVGESMRDCSYLRSLGEIATANNWFLSKRDLSTANFLQNVASSLSVRLFDLPTMHIEIGNFMRHLKIHKCIPAILPDNLGVTKVRLLYRTASYFQHQMRVIRHAEAEQRNKPKSKRLAGKG